MVLYCPRKTFKTKSCRFNGFFFFFSLIVTLKTHLSVGIRYCTSKYYKRIIIKKQLTILIEQTASEHIDGQENTYGYR